MKRLNEENEVKAEQMEQLRVKNAEHVGANEELEEQYTNASN
jgi:hypothetical protein